MPVGSGKNIQITTWPIVLNGKISMSRLRAYVGLLISFSIPLARSVSPNMGKCQVHWSVAETGEMKRNYTSQLSC